MKASPSHPHEVTSAVIVAMIDLSNINDLMTILIRNHCLSNLDHNVKRSIILKSFNMFYLNYRDTSEYHCIVGSFETLLEAKESLVTAQTDEPHRLTDDDELCVTDEMDNEFFFT